MGRTNTHRTTLDSKTTKLISPPQTSVVDILSSDYDHVKSM